MEHLGTRTLETERLLLRRFTQEDAEAIYHNWASDSEVTKYLTWRPHADLEVTRGFLAEWQAAYERPDYYLWAIVPREVGEPIGSISVVRQDDDLRMVHIGYCIGTKWWHRGYMSQALGALIRYFFEEVGINRVESRHSVLNPNSGAVMQTCGLRYEGTKRQGDRCNSGISDSVEYAILAEDYFAARK